MQSFVLPPWLRNVRQPLARHKGGSDHASWPAGLQIWPQPWSWAALRSLSEGYVNLVKSEPREL